ncbi:unnamed protein product [Cuscuta campestris]|uniref:Uncharacterized protein n=1 Tax=Cuscuta campestris TaxID=132261 RepID=A0A484LX01_9ASTE|nr:unnamed protein product [Cuscuta campestris]
MASRTKRKTIRPPASSSLPGSSSQPQSTPEISRFEFAINPRIFFQKKEAFDFFHDSVLPRKIITPRFVDLVDFERDNSYEQGKYILTYMNLCRAKKNSQPYLMLLTYLLKRKGFEFVDAEMESETPFWKIKRMLVKSGEQWETPSLEALAPYMPQGSSSHAAPSDVDGDADDEDDDEKDAVEQDNATMDEE